MKENLNRKEDIKDSLLPILQDLLSEYMAIKPEKNNVMTRQNILKMITDLYQVIYKDESKVTLSDVLSDISHVWDSKKDFNIFNPMDNAAAFCSYLRMSDLSNIDKDNIIECVSGLQNKMKVKALLETLDK
jgi:hypothetical protein